MALHSFVAAIGGILLFSLIHVLFISRVGQRQKGLPPGPPTLPIIGNAHLMPEKPEQNGPHFEKWAREYGPIYSIVLGTQTWVVLNKDWLIKDLLDKRGAIYSSRPDAHLAQEVFSGGMRAFLLKEGPQLKRNRRLGRIHLSEKVSATYFPYQDLENKAMLVGFLEKPDNFLYHIKRFTTSLSTSIIFGFRVITEDDPLPKRLFHTGNLLDMYPILRWLPDFLLPEKKKARQYHKNECEMFMRLYDDIRQKAKAGTAPQEENMSDLETAYTVGSLLQGGLGSTTETLNGFIKAMVFNPRVVEAAHAELDRVCGDRMPQVSDWSNLPYIRGCIKEALRWMPASPLGIPHAVTADDEYMGYRIPKGATVLSNIRAIHNDAERYPSPREFDPLRWADDATTAAQSAVSADVSKRDHFMFGAGRRMCQGMHIAERSLYLAVSRLLWGFDFKRAVDPATKKELPLTDMDDLQGGMFVMPRPYPVDIRPRDKVKAEVIRAAWAEASTSYLDENLQWIEVPSVSVWADKEELASAAAAAVMRGKKDDGAGKTEKAEA